LSKKILIIGKNSFLATHLYAYLKKYFSINKISYQKFKTLKLSSIEKYTHIINCSIHPNYHNKRYNSKYDIDLNILNKIKDINLKYIFLSTRKVYKEKFNIKENDKIETTCNYSKNKIKTEKKLLLILKKNLIILRISNILGIKKNLKNKRKIHKLFLDNYINSTKNKKPSTFDNGFKDFITIEQFCDVIYKIIKSKIYGIYNLSLGKKIYIKEIVEWLNKPGMQKIIINNNMDKKNSFTLSNNKLSSKLNIDLKKSIVKKFCNNLFR